MNKLLSAAIVRLWKNKVFLSCVIATILLILILCVNQYINMKKFDATISFDKLFLAYSILTGFSLAVFISLFLGTEYSDGTMRNKLIVGHSRYSVYLANFLCCAFAGVLLDVIFMIVIACIGIPMFGFFKSSVPVILLYIADGCLLTVSFAALFTMMSMLVTNRSVNGILCLLLVAAGTVIAGIFLARLQEPEMIHGVVITADGMQQAEGWVNPLYLQPAQRVLYELLMDLLPSGQGLQIGDLTAVHPIRMAVISAAESVLFTLAGMWVFNRKDLK